MVADLACRIDGGVRKEQPGAFFPEMRADVEPLHFANAISDFSQRHTTSGISLKLSQEQPTFGWSVLSGKIGKLSGEVLKAKIYPGRVGILLKKVPHDGQMLC